MLFPACFAIIVGVAMIAQWFLSYRANRIPELHTEPISIRFHIAAEMVTAALLIVSGAALLAAFTWGTSSYFVAIGMLLYTAIASPGYFAQRGQRAWLFLFGAIILLGIVSILLLSM